MNGDLVTANGQVDVSSLDPTQVGIGTPLQVFRLLFDGLVTTDENNGVELWGADTVRISPDGLTCTFHLRPGQRFSDGTPVMPSDYAWSFDRAFKPCVASLALAIPSLEAMKDAATCGSERCSDGGTSADGAITTLVGDSILPDDSAGTLTILLARPTAAFLDALTMPSRCPSPPWSSAVR